VKARAVDRRIQRTRQLLHGSLMAPDSGKGFEALSVQDIIDRANVGRATFYAHFDSKEDLLASGIENLRESLKQRQRQALSARGSDERFFAFSRELFTHANEHRTVFRAMVGKRSGASCSRCCRRCSSISSERSKATWAGRAKRHACRSGLTIHRRRSVRAADLVGQRKMRMAVDDVDSMFRRLAIPSLKAAAR
jgi:AcrR family transcriptional regulator